MLTRRRMVALCAASACVPAAFDPAISAQEWPNRVVRFMVPVSAGGPTDLVARIVAEALSKIWHQQVVVENKAGAGTNLGNELVARSELGGDTIMHRMSRRTLIKTASASAAMLPLTVAAAHAQAQQPKRVYIVQSYEKGHVCGEPQAEGILEALAAAGWTSGKNLTVRTYYMDTYRVNATPEAMQREGQKALEEIAAFQPELVFALDDAAARQVMIPLVGRSDVSVVFSGMNGQPEMYNGLKKYMDSRAHPGSNVTGVYEKLYAAQSLKVMAQAVPGLRGSKAVMITDFSPTGNGLTKQFELQHVPTGVNRDSQRTPKERV